MKYFVISDVHGYFYEMLKALDDAGFDPTNPNHTLINIGDAIDRGPFIPQVMRYLVDLPRKVLICGNHEIMADEAIQRKKYSEADKVNGLPKTFTQLLKANDQDVALQFMDCCVLYDRYMNELVWYHETKNYVFTHGWIPCDIVSCKEINKQIVCEYKYNENWRWADVASWDRALWVNGMDAWKQGVREPDKTIVCGHYHASWGHCRLHNDHREWPDVVSRTPCHDVYTSEPFIDEGIIAIDACTMISHRVNCVVIDDEELTQDGTN